MPKLGANEIPRKHVPGVGPIPAPIMLVGEAPGETENYLGQPFVGSAGQELTRYLAAGGLTRDQVYITNLCKYWPPVDFRGSKPKQLPPTKEDIARDESELLMELELVSPRIVGTIGAHASRYFLESRFGSMFRDHGIPRVWRCRNRQHPDSRNPPSYIPCSYWSDHLDGPPPCQKIIIPLTHPAAGLHTQSQEEMAKIQWDFQQLGRIYRGQIPAVEPKDQYPNRKYTRLYDAQNGPQVLAEVLAGRTYLSLDTEGPVWDPECVTICVKPGEAWYVGNAEIETLAALNSHINAPHAVCTVGCHYIAHDIPVLAAMGVYVDRRRACNVDGSPTLRCTLNDLHLLGGTEPKGLKPSQWRLVGTESEEYEEVVAEAEYEKVRGYFERAFAAHLCGECVGTGKVASYKVWDLDCSVCGGTSRVGGKRAGTTKNCSCVKSADRCLYCTDGLTIPLPPKELEFKDGQLRWKQPQSISKWLKRRLTKESLLDADNDEEDNTDNPDETPDENAEDINPSIKPYFQLRKDWYDKAPGVPKSVIEKSIGRIPRTRLSDVRDQDRVTRYACGDADAGLRITSPLDHRIRELRLGEAQRIDNRMIPMLAEMEQNGMRIDRGHFGEFSKDLGRELEEISHKLNDLVGERNPNSRRLAGVLFGQLGLPSIKLTKTGLDAIDDEVLETLKQQMRRTPDKPEHVIGIEVIQCMQDYRERLKLKTTYVDPILEKADKDDRIHTTLKYHQSMTRLSSEDPNLQNISNPDNHPAGNDPIKNTSLRLKNGFVARPGYVLIDADYSSIELVVGAHLSQDRNLLRVFREGLDPHRYAATHLLGWDLDRINDVPKPIRTQCKTLNFAAFYDTSAPTLQTQFALMQPPIEKTLEECEELIRWYFSDFAPDVMAWKERTRKQARIDGYVRTMFGRLRWMTGLRSEIKRVRSAAERECTNAPIQGSAGDILRIALGDLHEHTVPALRAEGIDILPVNTVHDAVVFECQEEYAEDAKCLIQIAMQNAVRLSVPIKVGVKSGMRWGEI